MYFGDFMKNRDKNSAKLRLNNVLLECEQVGITPEELSDTILDLKIPLVTVVLDTMFSSLKKKTTNLEFILGILVKLLSTAILVLEKHDYNVETEKKTIEYVNSILFTNIKGTPRPPAPEPLVLIKG
jgi:hypothetical protein